MATFNFTIRAIDSAGAFADQAFSMDVLNTAIDRFVMVNNTDAVSSPDCVTYHLRPGVSGNTVIYGNGMWIIYNNESLITSSRPSSVAPVWTSGGSALTTTYWYSADGANWTHSTVIGTLYDKYSTPALLTQISNISFCNSMFCMTASSSSGYITFLTSVDAINWTVVTTQYGQSGALTWNGYGYAGGPIISNGSTIVCFGVYMSTTYLPSISTNGGNTWTQTGVTLTPSTGNTYPIDAIYANGLWIAISYGGTVSATQYIMTSPDGFNWTQRVLPLVGVVATHFYPTKICYGNGLFIITGQITAAGYNDANGIGFQYWYSSDGINWSIGTTNTSGSGAFWGNSNSSSGFMATCAFSGGKFLIVPYLNYATPTTAYEPLWSYDGINWTVTATGVGIVKVNYFMGVAGITNG